MYHVRETKWDKARPIAPQTKHPMSKLFSITGRAWSFITAHLPGEHFVINNSTEVPEFLHEATQQLSHLGKIKVDIQDIEGCFPNMEKNTIKLALRSITKQVQQTYNTDCVYVPSRRSLPCKWHTEDKRYKRIPLHILNDVIDFVLENTLIKTLTGNLMKQDKQGNSNG